MKIILHYLVFAPNISSIKVSSLHILIIPYLSYVAYLVSIQQLHSKILKTNKSFVNIVLIETFYFSQSLAGICVKFNFAADIWLSAFICSILSHY